MRGSGILLPVLAVAALAAAFMSSGCARRTDADYVREVDDWHAERIERLLGESGWLTLVGLHPLAVGENTVGSAEGMDVRLIESAPSRLGVLVVGQDRMEFAADPAAEVVGVSDSSGGRVTKVAMAADSAGDPTVLRCGTISFHVIARGERLYLRVKDSDSAIRRNFRGVERFPVDAQWRVTARLEAGDPDRGVMVPDVLGRLVEEQSPGVLVFDREGSECRLTPIGAPGEPLFIVFSDRTTGYSTYGGGRFLSADPPDADGNVILDFNLAVNPPCVFTDFATCPLPPDGNDLPVSVTAGEKMWGGGHH